MFIYIYKIEQILFALDEIINNENNEKLFFDSINFITKDDKSKIIN